MAFSRATRSLRRADIAGLWTNALSYHSCAHDRRYIGCLTPAPARTCVGSSHLPVRYCAEQVLCRSISLCAGRQVPSDGSDRGVSESDSDSSDSDSDGDGEKSSDIDVDSDSETDSDSDGDKGSDSDSDDTDDEGESQREPRKPKLHTKPKHQNFPPPRPLDETQLRESFVRGGGPGGQKINKSSNCVQITHLPTGTQVFCQRFRDLTSNRKAARTMLVEKLDLLERGRDSKMGRRFDRLRKRKANAQRRANKKYREEDGDK